MEMVQYFIPVVVPMAIAFGKWLLPSVPKVALPIVAPLLGAALDIVLYWASVTSTRNPMLGMVLGALGVVVRELVDQVKNLWNGRDVWTDPGKLGGGS